MTREMVLRAAREVLASKPHAPLHEVAGAAGVARATVYRMFGSRERLLAELDLGPQAPDGRQRVLEAALTLIGRDGLARLSIDEVAAAANVSRSSFYRMFPGKASLFREVLVAYSPLDAIARTIEQLHDQPPELVMPEIARTAARTLAGRVGMVRTLFFEATSASAETAEAMHYVVRRFLQSMSAYLMSQFAAGRLKPMHPLLAFQGFAGPILMHMLTRTVVERELGFNMSIDDSVTALAENWVRSMKPEEER